MFQILAEGPGCAVGGGGRYDGLLARYGVDRPAAGFALDLDHLSWALQWQGRIVAPPPKVLVALDGSAPEIHDLMRALRARLIPCVPAPDAEIEAYAHRWDFTHVLAPGKDDRLVLRSGDTSRTLTSTDSQARADEIASFIDEDAPESQELAASIGERT